MAAAALAVVLLPAVPVAASGSPSGADTVGLFDPNTSTWYLFGGDGRSVAAEFGSPGVLPVAGDWATAWTRPASTTPRRAR
jgi:hypothetical protein